VTVARLKDHTMQPRLKNPAMILPGAIDALQKLGAAARSAGVPATTLYLIEVRASQINGCSVCLDMHSRE
jgi:alkylhydroperoxidase family enzyme